MIFLNLILLFANADEIKKEYRTPTAVYKCALMAVEPCGVMLSDCEDNQAHWCLKDVSFEREKK